MIDLSTMTLTVSGSQLTVNTSVNPMKLSTNGAVQRPGQTMFVAVDNGSGWIYFAGDGWTKIPFNNLGSSPNVGSCFNLGTSRFTAPVTGLYWFTASTYLYKDTGSAGYYMHPMFWLMVGVVLLLLLAILIIVFVVMECLLLIKNWMVRSTELSDLLPMTM